MGLQHCRWLGEMFFETNVKVAPYNFNGIIRVSIRDLAGGDRRVDRML